jgi:hypothetical protein
MTATKLTAKLMTDVSAMIWSDRFFEPREIVPSPRGSLGRSRRSAHSRLIQRIGAELDCKLFPTSTRLLRHHHCVRSYGPSDSLSGSAPPGSHGVDNADYTDRARQPAAQRANVHRSSTPEVARGQRRDHVRQGPVSPATYLTSRAGPPTSSRERPRDVCGMRGCVLRPRLTALRYGRGDPRGRGAGGLGACRRLLKANVTLSGVGHGEAVRRTRAATARMRINTGVTMPLTSFSRRWAPMAPTK